MIRTITLIEPKNDHLHIFSRFELPRLGGILLATIMRDRGYNARALYMSRREIAAYTIDTDLVGISTITATAVAAYAIADDFRGKGVPVVFGGPHVSFLPEEALQHADYCVTGEGETCFPLLVAALNGEGSLDDVPGLVWRENGTIRRNASAAPIEDLDTLPFPDFSLLTMGRGVTMGGAGNGRATLPVQTSRGCPFDCTFCSVTGMFGRHYRHRSTASIIAELSRYNPKEYVIFFYDDNFTASPRKAKELLREMIRLRLGFTWSTQVRSDVARDPELLDLMAEAGCATLFIGFESVDPKALKEMKKNQTVEEIRHAIREIRSRKIHVHGMFVFGFDSDTAETTRATVDFALAEKIDSAQFLILTPLPGVELLHGDVRAGPAPRHGMGHLRRSPREVRAPRLHPVRAAEVTDRGAPTLLRPRARDCAAPARQDRRVRDRHLRLQAQPPVAAHGEGVPGAAAGAAADSPAALRNGSPPRPSGIESAAGTMQGTKALDTFSRLFPWLMRKRLVFALVGKSGTGKSFKAREVARRFRIDLIIDDGLLIRGKKIMAGRSAKREKGILSAIKTAVFANPDQIKEVRQVLAERARGRVLIIGTSRKMIMRIATTLELLPVHRVISIEEVSTREEISRSLRTRAEQGKHIIPVPGVEIKRNYPHIFFESVQVLLKGKKGLRRSEEEIVEKTVVRPEYGRLRAPRRSTPSEPDTRGSGI